MIRDSRVRCLPFRIVISAVLMLTISRWLPENSAAAQSLSERLRAEPAAKLAADAREQGDAVRGAVLFTQPDLNCTKCHAASVKPIGPNLSGLGADADDVYLVEALLEPSRVIRKGFESVAVVTTSGKTFSGRIAGESVQRVILQTATGDLRRIAVARDEIEEIATIGVSAMPANLADQLQNRGQFLDLLRYVMELAASEARPFEGHPGGESIRSDLNGIVLLKEYNCGGCHADNLTNAQVGAKRAPDLKTAASRLRPGFLTEFLADPLHVRPGTTMPDVMQQLSPAERRTAARQLTHYVSSLSQEQAAGDRVMDSSAAERGEELFHSVGCVACHSPRNGDGAESLRESSVPLGALHEKYQPEGLAAFLEDPHSVRPSGRMPDMKLSHWEATDIAAFLLSGGDASSESSSFRADTREAERGKLWFRRLRCGQCHDIDGDGAENGAVSLELAEVRPDHGCLSDEAGVWPEFALSDDQRRDIRAALQRGAQDLSTDDQTAITMTAFRCLNCHQRNELGGVSAERDPHFRTANPNLGPQGRIPPTLTGVGAKLNPTWLRQVLVSGRAIRPYLLTRMPQYGADNVAHLVDLFGTADSLPPVEFAEFSDRKVMRETGAEMVGTGGLNCIVCHTFRLQKAANMPAVDLTEMSERLQKNWFYHYMRDPGSLSPNTIMPAFWPGGRSMRSDFLNGDRDLQIEALWQYLLDGRQARTPRGLIVEPLELLATDEAVMLRRSYPGVGKRGIGVGYPLQMNLVFDAEQMRLAMIWQGKFADPAGVWRSQGHGRVRPLSRKPVEFAAGPDLDRRSSPWIVSDERPPEHRFRGYSLDGRMRPVFHYNFAGIRVQDYSVDSPGRSADEAELQRTITLSAEAAVESLRFRVATGNAIERRDDGSFVIDDRLFVRIGEPHAGEITENAESQELLIPLDVPSGITTVHLNYRISATK